jgi:predicted DNA-binding protein
MGESPSMPKHILVELPREMHEELALLSLYSERSMSAIVRDALKQTLTEAKQDGRLAFGGQQKTA